MVFGSIADIFNEWEYLGVFDFILPFLLVFAIVYGILAATNILGANKGVSVIISLVVGLMSLRYQGRFAPFLSELFPRLGIGVAVLLTVLILVGLFIADKQRKYWFYGLGALGAVIALIAIWQSFDRLGLGFGRIGSDGVGFIILGVLLIGLIIAVAASGGRRRNGEEDDGSITLTPFRRRH